MSDAYQGAQDAEFRSQRAVMERLLPLAVEQAMMSPCAKSKRGALLVDAGGWTGTNRGVVIGKGFNAPPGRHKCDGSDACRAACGRICEHAEAAAIRNAMRYPSVGYGLGCDGLHMLHVKAVEGAAVTSGPPSCEKCSVTMLAHKVSVMWLLRPWGLAAYAMDDFHAETLDNLHLPVIR